MPTLNELANDERFARLRRFAERLGPFSPFVTIDTFSPASRLLLADAERSIERILHVVRLVIGLAATAIAFFGFGLIDLPVQAWVPASLVFLVAMVLWVWVWRLLGRRQASVALRCGLILFDGYLIARGIVLFGNPGKFYGLLAPEIYRTLTTLITPGDVQAVTPPMLVFFALTGAFRLDPRLGVFSTIVALGIYGYLRSVFAAPPVQTWVVGLVIWFSGALGANAARVIRYMTLKASQERVLERYVPAALTQEILRSGDPGRAPRSEEITVLMSDIRGFTRMSESLTPAAAVELLNDCFGVLVGPLAEHGAVLDKYIGDGLLAFFEGPRHAERALRAGRQMLTALTDFNTQRTDRPLRVGIAIHTGPTLLGTVGAGTRRDYTVIGDVVNVTARLEEMNKRLNSSLIISAAALSQAANGQAIVDLQGPTSIELRGREATVEVHFIAREA